MRQSYFWEIFHNLSGSVPRMLHRKDRLVAQLRITLGGSTVKLMRAATGSNGDGFGDE